MAFVENVIDICPLWGLRKARKEQFMPRPVKCRKVCHFPNVLEFLPADNTELIYSARWDS